MSARCRSALSALGAIALIAGIAGLAACSAPPAVTPTISMISLAPSVLEAGLPYAGTLVVKSTGSVTVQAIKVDVRTAAGTSLDFPGARSAAINGAFVYTSAARSFAAGTYTDFGVYEINNAWHPFASQTLTVVPGPSSSDPNPGPVGIPGSWTSTLNDGPTYSNGAVVDAVGSIGQWIGASGIGLAPPNNLNEIDCYNPANFSLTRNYARLSLTTGHGQSACMPFPGADSEPDYGAQIYTSNATFEQQYGAFEAGVYLPPAANGSIADWPAFWLDPMDGSVPWPTGGEIDIVEGLTHKGSRMSEACYHVHWGTSAGNRFASGGCDAAIGPGWHTFGADWQVQHGAGRSKVVEYKVTFYYDGKAVGTVVTGRIQDLTPMNVVFDITDAFGSPVSSVPATMKVAYVRAWSGS
jgi:Glycosyl hydrolases family 16